MPGGRATKPGDIVTTAGGLSVQVINTDAEGRMLLADALSMAGRESSAAMVDVATLTGAVVIALGHECTGGMGRGGVVAELAAAGEKSGERIWELPMWREFGEPFESPFADLKNMGDGTAGTIEAAKFLERFVPEGMPWGHLDIAGTAWWESEKAWSAPGATLAMARTLAEWAETTKV
jgi:leucyl aminopeptidase